jgi:hypothetical protein
MIIDIATSPTPRVLALVAAGRSDRLISGELGLSKNIVFEIVKAEPSDVSLIVRLGGFRSFVATTANGEDAMIPDLPALASEREGSTQTGSSA